ncbi:DUF1161 domain-containing protein [Desulfobulbus sp. F4]|nr:DUF1161 domain-containing protein [Desulfobulbus sp. F3]MCW5200302.1 DUF1161 domain-containing protein [Desulfobulbus sp. F4]
MQYLFAGFSIFLLSLSQAVAAVKSCEELKAEIAVKIDSKRVKAYELKIADGKEQTTAGKIVGSCEDGSKKIVYIKQEVHSLLQNHAMTAPTTAGSAQEPSLSSRKFVPVVAVKMIQVESSSEVKSCDALKAEIADKLAIKGVQNYDLTVAVKGGATGKVVGSCENGSKYLFYTRK